MSEARQEPPASRTMRSNRERVRSPRGKSTMRAVLDTASIVFVEKGYEETSIAELVERSGISVGSIYHHFGGKAEVFHALYDEYYHRQRRRTEEASQRARDAGATDPTEIYLAGARAYLDSCWQDRGLTRLFHAGEGPPEQWRLRHERMMAWMHTNIEVLESKSRPHGISLARAVTALVAACALELTEIDSHEAASDVIDYYLDLIVRIAAP